MIKSIHIYNIFSINYIPNTYACEKQTDIIKPHA